MTVQRSRATAIRMVLPFVFRHWRNQPWLGGGLSLAIVGATLLRSIFLYLQTVATNRIVMRIATDIQKRGFAHLVDADYARISREAPGQLVSNSFVMYSAARSISIRTAAFLFMTTAHAMRNSSIKSVYDRRSGIASLFRGHTP